MSLFSGVAFHRPLICLTFYSGVALLRPLISFFRSFFFSFWVHLQIVSFSLVFLVVSRRTRYLRGSYPFSGGLLIFPYDLAWGRPFTLCITDTSTCYGISWHADLSYFSTLKLQLARCLVSHGFSQSALSLQIGRLLLGTACQFIYQYKENLTVNRSARTFDPNPTLQTSRLLLQVREGNKRERESLYL